VQVSDAQSARLRLIGSDGRVYREKTILLQEGINRFPIEMQSLAAGSYVVVLETAGGVHRSPVVKQ
jgi:hypothetical protein